MVVMIMINGDYNDDDNEGDSNVIVEVLMVMKLWIISSKVRTTAYRLCSAAYHLEVIS